MRSLIILVVLSIGYGVAAAASSDTPKRKSGLWEMNMSGGNMPGGNDDAAVRGSEKRRHQQNAAGEKQLHEKRRPS